MSRKLLIISYEEFPSFIGLSSRIKGIAQSLIGCGFQLEIVAPCYSKKSKNHKIFLENLKIHRINMPNLFGRFQLPIISRLLFVLIYTIRVSGYYNKKKVEVSFVQSEQIYPFWSSYILGKKFKAEIILDEPTIFEDIIDHKLKKIKFIGYILKKLIKSFELIIYKMSNFIICSSEKTLFYVKNRINDNNKIYYIPNGVDINKFKFYKKNKFGNRIFFNCSLPYYQNIAALSNLIKIIKYFENNNFFNYFVQIIVNNKLLIPKELLDIMKSNDRVSILSGVNCLVPYIQKADMVVLPYERGHFSNAGPRIKTLEALACGKVVFSTLEGIDGLSGCIDGENIIICIDWIDMAKKIINIINSYDKTYKINIIQNNARHFVEENYSWDKLVKAYDLILKQRLQQ
ncbi:MAG: glycosyltransferase [Promethearchaeota archaeon]